MDGKKETGKLEGFSFVFEPVEDSVTIEKVKKQKKDGPAFVARYITPDDINDSPDDWGDDNLFLVGYHRDFSVDRGQRELVTIFKESEFKKDNGYSGRAYADGYGWKSYEEAKAAGLINKQVRRGRYVPGISQELAQCIARGGKYEDGSENSEAKEYCKKYRIFGLEAYIHGGVVLALSHEGNFPDRRWDVSQLGLVFVSKEEWKTRKKARKAAQGLIETWNQYLSGDVYTIVREDYDKEKNQINYDCVGGYYGREYAFKAVKTEV
ncbi:MAG TPA: hypothetical protein P5110_07000 [Candidatus Omnitrophota bacterium]|nr:hypothetical protein [Candidatus Omnitrophota bacterium]